jgi:hypothetical protein
LSGPAAEGPDWLSHADTLPMVSAAMATRIALRSSAFAGLIVAGPAAPVLIVAGPAPPVLIVAGPAPPVIDTRGTLPVLTLAV